MSAQHLKLIAIGLAVLLLLWGGSALFSRGSDTVTGGLALPALTVGETDTIAIATGADTLVLAKQSATAWLVNGHRAPLAGVTDVFQALQDSTHPELVAQDVSSFGRLGVDSVTGRWLRIRGGGKALLQLIVGAPGAGFQSVYVRRPGDAHVYLWRGRLAAVMDRRSDDWRDKRIATLAPDSIGAVAVERGKDRYTLLRRGARWAVNGGAADSAAVVRYLDRLRTVMASGFATPQAVDSTKGRRATRQLTVRGGGGSVLLTLAFDSTAGSFLVRHLAGVGGEGSTVYRMNIWDVDGLTPASRSFAHAKS
ncbi:MAG TPA: DUF4340 domain-containing protein [Gemmatimonadales bacterium]|nr:DUF4340 domain-containing protein [Gemmatimonadales bacterium]